MTSRTILSAAALTLALTATQNAEAGTHIGNIWLKMADDSTPLVTMNPDRAPRLAVWTCGGQSPTIVTATEGAQGTYFKLDSEMGTICKIGVDLGSPVDLAVAGVYTATAEPVAEAQTISPTSVYDLVDGTLRSGTNTMMSLLRSIAAVPRTATSSEEATISSQLSVLVLDL